MLNFKLLPNFESIAIPHFEHNIAQRFSANLGQKLQQRPGSLSLFKVTAQDCLSASGKNPKKQLGQNSWSWLVFNIMLYE